MDSQNDDVGIRPSRAPSRAGTTIPVPASTAASVASAARASAARCVALFELFRGGSGAVQLGRLHDGTDAPRLVSLRRLANIPTRELESATTRAQGVTHPRLARVLGTYQHEDAWYIASEYIPGVTLFELGQTAVRQRTPVAAPVAVRIVLDALQATGEAEELFAEITGSPRCLYPESIWIAESGELFLSELLVAPVLARTTTGASYVAVTAGMSAPASDVRAAAVELARLACARLMNGNPASWQTRELPDELSELLARAVRGGPGAETPAAFAVALSALDPRLIASRESVQEEVERLMGPERVRRREQLQTVQEQTAEPDTARVFRVAPPAPAVPDFGKAFSSAQPPPLGPARLAAARASTIPPPKPRSAKPHAAASRIRNPTPTIPGAPPTPPPPVETADSAISGVWREAHLRLGAPGRRTRRKTNPGETETPAPSVTATALPEPVQPPVAAPSPVAAQPPVAGPPKSSKHVVLIALGILALVALGAVLGATWRGQGGSVGQPSSTQHLP